MICALISRPAWELDSSWTCQSVSKLSKVVRFLDMLCEPNWPLRRRSLHIWSRYVLNEEPFKDVFEEYRLESNASRSAFGSVGENVRKTQERSWGSLSNRLKRRGTKLFGILALDALLWLTTHDRVYQWQPLVKLLVDISSHRIESNATSSSNIIWIS